MFVVCCRCFVCHVYVVFVCFFFFFKQKTAYEMRISDWSSDVCSSDLVEVSLIAGEQKGDAYLAQNAQGFVPMLVADGEPIIQSLAIIDWLDRAQDRKSVV